MTLLDDREERFKKLDEDLIAVLQFKANVVGLYPCQVLQKHKSNPQKHNFNNLTWYFLLVHSKQQSWHSDNT